MTETTKTGGFIGETVYLDPDKLPELVALSEKEVATRRTSVPQGEWKLASSCGKTLADIINENSK